MQMRGKLKILSLWIVTTYNSNNAFQFSSASLRRSFIMDASTSQRRRRGQIMIMTDPNNVGGNDISSDSSNLSDSLMEEFSSENFEVDSPISVVNIDGDIEEISANVDYIDMTNLSNSSVPELKQNPMTRRDWLQTSAIIFGITVLGTGEILHERATIKNSISNSNKRLSLVGAVTTNISKPEIKRLEAVNITQIIRETNVNVTLNNPESIVSIDSTTFTKVQTAKVPKWLPTWFALHPKIIKEISNTELLVASIIAGSFVDFVRTSILYPIQTIKTRIQTEIHKFENKPPPLGSRIVSLGSNIQKHVVEGSLYAGIKPTLLVSVPATGVYYGIRDVSKRMLQMSHLSSVEIALCSALIADVISLSFRTPADTLALRLQNMDDDVGDWFGDSIKRLPSVIITDLPYLLSKISLNRLLIHGNISMDVYIEFAVFTATIAAILTTPFDVARTRILVDSDGNFSNGKDGGSGEGVLQTMIRISKEGDRGIVNLFAGWFERALYLGFGRAWLEPIQLIGYIGIRDAVILTWF